MKKWHLEGIVSCTGRSSPKLEIPDPTRRNWWIGSSAMRVKKDFFLLRLVRLGRTRAVKL